MYLLALIGIVVVLAAVVLLVNPNMGFEFAEKYFFSTKFQYGVALLSIALGSLFYVESAAARFSALFLIFAVVCLVGGLVCLLLPHALFERIVSWELKTFRPYGRGLGILYGLVGGLLIFAAA